MDNDGRVVLQGGAGGLSAGHRLPGRGLHSLRVPQGYPLPSRSQGDLNRISTDFSSIKKYVFYTYVDASVDFYGLILLNESISWYYRLISIRYILIRILQNT